MILHLGNDIIWPIGLNHLQVETWTFLNCLPMAMYIVDKTQEGAEFSDSSSYYIIIFSRIDSSLILGNLITKDWNEKSREFLLCSYFIPLCVSGMNELRMQTSSLIS